MIPEIGHFALVLALVLALLTATLPMIGAARGDARLVGLATPLTIAQFAFVALAFAALVYAYLVSDFSVSNVAANSHTAKPLLYKLTGAWGNHEGSLVLWVLILTLFGALVGAFGRTLPESFKARVLAVQAMIAVGFLLFMLVTSNPFLRVDPAPEQGNGLNPLLQDPGLAFHPPLLYLGYVGFSMAFAFAAAALIEGRVGPSWARWMRPWVLLAWIALTAGIALGSWWAYYELGWGGWWFWDPVENASFMPWLAGTALLHSTIVVEKRDGLKRWTILLAILTFSLSLLGTFLVRSGVLTSVHAFAVDPDRGMFILALLAIAIGGSLALYGRRAPGMEEGGLFAPVSREGALVINNILLSVAAAIVLVGTLYPLFLDVASGEQISVGPPFFNMTFTPLMGLLIVVLGIGPLLAWKRGDLRGALKRLKPAAGLAALGGALAWTAFGAGPVLAVIGFALASWLAAAVIVEWARRVKLTQGPPRAVSARARRLPRAQYGMSLAHLGLAVMVFGITASESWETEKLAVLQPGESAMVGAYRFAFSGADPVAGPNYTAIRGNFEVFKGDRRIATMRPEQRSYTTPQMQTTEAAIHPVLSGDLYAVIGDPGENGGWSARLYHKPLVFWIWLGPLIMIAGGALALSDRRLRIGAPVRAKRAGGGSAAAGPAAQPQPAE